MVLARRGRVYPQFKFLDIGRNCFAWALKQAWREAREAVAAIPAEVRADRIQTLQASIEPASDIDHGPTWRATIAGYRNELRQLQSV